MKKLRFKKSLIGTILIITSGTAILSSCTKITTSGTNNVPYQSNANHCAKLQTILNKFRVKNKITGMGLYVHSPRMKPESCYLFSGSVIKGSYHGISGDNLWQIASISKSYFSAILLQLEAESEAGSLPVKFNLNQKLKYWLPQYPNWGNVTIKQLLNMTSGIYSYTELPISQMVLNNPKKIWTLDEIVNLAYQHNPNTYFYPGDGWHYSDTDYIIVGQLIEKIYRKITGHRVSLETILEQRILSKLKLNNTYYYPSGLPKDLLARMVHGYNYYTGKDFTALNLSIAGPSGGIISNPKEIANWIEALFDGEVLPKKQMKELLSLVSMNDGEPVAITSTKNEPAYSLGLTEQYSEKLGATWLYEGLSSGYSAGYFYVPKYHVVISYTASIGSIKNNPIKLSQVAKKTLELVINN